MKRISMAALIIAAGLALFFANMRDLSSPTEQLFLWIWLVCVLSLAATAALSRPVAPTLLFAAVATGAVVSAALAVSVSSGASTRIWLLTVPLLAGQVVIWWASRPVVSTRERMAEQSHARNDRSPLREEA